MPRNPLNPRPRYAVTPGTRFHRLLVTPRTARLPGGHKAWVCECDCGNECLRRPRELLTGDSRSCGCSRTESFSRTWREKMASRPPVKRKKTPEYQVWTSAKGRCSRKNGKYWNRYGGRGIAMCDKWRRSFGAFLADMGRRPSPQHSLDRINNDGNYEPGNCRWATRREQMQNRSDNSRVTIGGETLVVTEWTRRLGIYEHLAAVYRRIHHGWDPVKALKTPFQISRPRTQFVHDGIVGLPAIAEAKGMSMCTLRVRLRRGWSLDRAATTPVARKKRAA